MNWYHVNGNVWKRTITFGWAGGKILVTEYEQRFKENAIVWYKYVVKRINGTIVEEMKRRGVDFCTILDRLDYYGSLDEAECTKIRECDQRYGRQRTYLPESGGVRAWSVQ